MERQLSVADDSTPQPTSHKFFVVHGKNDVEQMEVDHADRTSILTAIRIRFGSEVEDRKMVNFIGGVLYPVARQVLVLLRSYIF